MKKFSLGLLLVTVIFGGNIVLFRYVPAYQNFVESWKHDANLVTQNDITPLDEENAGVTSEIAGISESYTPTDVIDEILWGNDGENEVEVEERVQEGVIPNEEEREAEEGMRLHYRQQDFLDAFALYTLEKTVNPLPLYGVFSDFPKNVMTYAGNGLDVYIFAESSYSEVRSYLYERLFWGELSINEVNNFGEESLFVNGIEGKVNILVRQNGYIFGLQMEKIHYADVKQILLSFNE